MGHNLFKRVPEELVMVIMAHLSLPDLLCSAALVRPSSLGIALSKKSGQTCRRFAEVVSNDAFWQEKCKTMLSPADLSVCVRSLDSATSKQHETKSPNRLLRWKDIGQALAGFQWSEQLKSTGIAISSDLMEAECHDGSWNSVRANSPLQRGRWRLWFNIRKPPSNSSKNTAVGYSHLDYGSSKEWSSHVNCFMKDSTTGKSFGLHESMRVYYTKSRYCDSPMLPAVKDESYPMGLELDLFEHRFRFSNGSLWGHWVEMPVQDQHRNPIFPAAALSGSKWSVRLLKLLPVPIDTFEEIDQAPDSAVNRAIAMQAFGLPVSVRRGRANDPDFDCVVTHQ